MAGKIHFTQAVFVYLCICICVFGHPTLTQDQYQENASPYSSIFSLGRSIVVETAVPRFGATRPNTLQ